MLVASPGSGEPPAAAALADLCAQPPCLSACRAAFHAACLLVGLRLSLAPSLPHGVRWCGFVVEHAQQR